MKVSTLLDPIQDASALLDARNPDPKRRKAQRRGVTLLYSKRLPVDQLLSRLKEI